MRFSIITPGFNQLDWLRLCVRSVADQNGVEVEHVIQDGGTDGIEDFAREVGAEFHRNGEPVFAARESAESTTAESAAKDKESARRNRRLAVFSEADSGMYDAINRGLTRGTGEICAWLNCDEQYLPETLSRVAHYFRAHPDVEVVFGDAILVDPSGDALGYRMAVTPCPVHIRLSHLNILTCAMFFRRTVFQSGFQFETRWKIIGDVEWVWRLLQSRVTVGILNDPLAAFTFTGKNLSELNRGENSEQTLWANADDAPSKWRRPMAILAHRIRKFLAGSYQRRSFDYSIYSFSSPDIRTLRRAVKIGGRWPDFPVD